MPLENTYEIDMDYLRSAERCGGFIADHVPMIGEENLLVIGPDGERFPLHPQVNGVRRSDETGMRFKIGLEGFPLELTIRLADERQAIPAGRALDSYQPKLFRRRRTSRPASVPPPSATDYPHLS